MTAIRQLTVELSERSYPIHIGPGLLADPAPFAGFRSRRMVVVTDDNVGPHYLGVLNGWLGMPPDRILVLPAGEAYKSWETVSGILDWLLAQRLARDGLLLALGGGVIGDMAGFAAAIYQRGIDFAQLPTTLLSQVDSSVGGKTGVNHARGKNLIGAFHQPKLVIADTSTLKTLPAREIAAGIAEIIKCGMLGDAALFARLERDIDRVLALEDLATAEAIERSVKLKARVVALDERESVAGGPRALLNLGHTFAHAVETYTGYGAWLHGEAVGLGLCMAADLSARLGFISETDAARCTALVARAGLPVQAPPGMRPADFIELMARDKKVAAGKLRLVLLRAIGEASLTAEFDPALLEQTLAGFCESTERLA